MNVDDTADTADRSGAAGRRIGGPLHCRHPEDTYAKSVPGAAEGQEGVVAMGQQLTRGEQPQTNVATDSEQSKEEQHVPG